MSSPSLSLLLPLCELSRSHLSGIGCNVRPIPFLFSSLLPSPSSLSFSSPTPSFLISFLSPFTFFCNPISSRPFLHLFSSLLSLPFLPSLLLHLLSTSVGPSVDPSGVSFVDCIRVYGKAKDVFGWPEHPPDPLPPVEKTPSSSVTTTHQRQEENLEVVPFTSAKPLSSEDR